MKRVQCPFCNAVMRPRRRPSTFWWVIGGFFCPALWLVALWVNANSFRVCSRCKLPLPKVPMPSLLKEKH